MTPSPAPCDVCEKAPAYDYEDVEYKKRVHLCLRCAANCGWPSSMRVREAPAQHNINTPDEHTQREP